MMRPRNLPFVVLFCFALAAPALHAADAGRIKISSGAVHIERAGGRLAGAVDTAVQPGDTVITGANGSVGITFIDDSRVSVGPNSVFSINTYNYNQTTQGGTFDSILKRGTLGVVSGRMTKQSPEAVKVRTPTMVLGVRGTRFVVYAGE